MNTDKRAQKRREAAARKAQRKWVPPARRFRGKGYWISTSPKCEHGTWSGYNNWYCRCPDCSVANYLKTMTYANTVRNMKEWDGAADTVTADK